eukprot:TRINITY_DN73547_c0_g1_i1.p1 TRINITY_DN73547_c0_g1~~TRINITY_DN73547_c0_g1_i1.p1  ORF type:complete len:175 (-),score=51.89 TRINITY_DN73547_c0_g1_i1:146-670(-)
MAELPAIDLQARLQAVGVRPPTSSNNHEDWRRCLSDLCTLYLGENGTSDPSEEGLEPLPAEVQLAALQMKADAQRNRNFELLRELDVAVRQEAQLQRVAAADPVIAQRSLGEFVSCLQRVRNGCREAARDAAAAEPAGAFDEKMDEDCYDTDLSGFLSELQAVREQLAPLDGNG